jgi:Dolichyl-phosphate-mannose-protein mannosyltransferase
MNGLMNRLRHWLYSLLLLKGFVPACLALAFLLRVAWMLTFDVRPYTDFEWYYDRGLEIAQGGGYAINGKPTAYWPIGYPALLGLLFRLFGASITIAQFANVVMYMGVIYVSYTLSKQIFTSETIARITLLLLALYPNHIAYSTILASETPFLLLLMLGSAALVRSSHRSPLSWSVVAGVLFGFATLIRPQALLVPVIVLWACFGVTWARRRIVCTAALVYISLFLVLLPWTIRNTLLFQHVVFVSTNGGINLLIGNNPYATGSYIWNEQVSAPVKDIEDEYERDQRARAVALEYIKNNPLRIVMLWPSKIWQLYLYDTEGIATNLIGLRQSTPRMTLLLKFLIHLAFATMSWSCSSPSVLCC